MNTIEGFKHDGAKWGVSDFYPEAEKALLSALKKHKPFDTGWYGVKKEIQYGRVYSLDGVIIVCEASVLDDFDTEGHGLVEVPTWTMEAVQAGLDSACDKAVAAKRDNEPYIGFKIINAGRWKETYLLSTCEMDAPPGDNYHWWGWQSSPDETGSAPDPALRIPKATVNALESIALSLEPGESRTVGRWTIQRWQD